MKKEMKTVIFSDTHLTDKFDGKKFEYLGEVIDKADKVVINGDFWDSYYTTFDKFVESEWKKLFPLLKSKKTVYLYGNHDEPDAGIDERVKLFADKVGESFKLKSKKLRLHIEHGHRVYPEVRASLEWLRKHQLYKYYYSSICDALEAKVQKFFKNSPVTKFVNDEIKRLVEKRPFKKKEMFVMGHTHCAEIDTKNKYINTGINNFGVGNYLLVQEGKFKLVNTVY